MRIVDVCEFYSPNGGGVRSYVDRKMLLLAEIGHELIVLAPAAEDSIEERETGGTIIWIKAPALPFDKNYRMFWDAPIIHEWLDKLKPDVVEASSPWRPAWIVGKWAGSVPKVLFVHGDPMVSYPYRWFGKVVPRDKIDKAFEWFNRYLRRATLLFDRVVTCGPSIDKRLRGRNICETDLISLGIDRSVFSPDLRDMSLRADLLAQCDLPESAHLLMGVGRHHPEKRWPMVIDAVQAAATKMPIGLVQIGQGMDSAAIEKQVGENPHIRLFKPIYDRLQLARLLASADALVHGCEGEAFGTIAAEALASGLPMIVPDDGACAEIARPEFAEIFASNNTASASAAVIAMCSRDQDEVRAAARAASFHVRSDRDHVRDLVAHYQALIDAPYRVGQPVKDLA